MCALKLIDLILLESLLVSQHAATSRNLSSKGADHKDTFQDPPVRPADRAGSAYPTAPMRETASLLARLWR
ncbi:hypothetical protein BCV70DRAFT_198993 [Testicularia cyperi]|uniref:Secreted protein n=1 Tax=Testicularia cyperi TaxID=1882483 RepID=A0A317XU32_9BASI|nr:hypothetical protein BCV70DRAFT_198993 [Testicularia cyperi]